MFLNAVASVCMYFKFTIQKTEILTQLFYVCESILIDLTSGYLNFTNILLAVLAELINSGDCVI